MTPDYLGFLREEPTQSPLGAAITGGLETYGDVQRLRQQTMLTAAMPKEIAAEEALQKQAVETGALKEKYLPQQLETEQRNRDLLLKALPTQLSEQLTTERLNNLINRDKYSASQLGLAELQRGYVDKRLGELYGETIKGLPENIRDQQYQAIIKQAKGYGVDTADLPAKWDTSVAGRGAIAYANFPANVALQKYWNDVNKSMLDAYAKAQGKKGIPDATPYQKQWETDQSNADNKYYNQVTDSATRGAEMYGYAKRIMDIYDAHPDQFGAVIGRASSRWATAAQEANFNAINILLDRMQNFPATALRTTSMQDTFKRAKIDPTKDTLATGRYKAALIASEGLGRMLEADFDRYIRDQYGIRDNQQIQLSWMKFLTAHTEVMPDGRINPENLRNWQQWFMQHPDALPTSIRIKRDIQKMTGATGATGAGRGGLVTPGVTTPPQAQVTQTGVIPPPPPPGTPAATGRSTLSKLLLGTMIGI
jgi:hypothetical protein